MPKGRIKLNKATSGHREILEKLGYEVAETEFKGSPVLEVECTGFETGDVDFTSKEKATTLLRAMVKARRLFTYGTVFSLTIDGEVQTHKSIWAVRVLPNVVTALIAKPIVAKTQRAKPASDLDIDMGDL